MNPRPDPAEVEGVAARLAAGGVHTLLVQFADLHGSAKGKLVPLAQLGHVIAEGAGFAGPSIEATGLPRQGPRSEFFARGDLDTAHALPWWPGVARLVASGFVDGQPFEGCPRQALRRLQRRLAERGWHVQLGIEPEFFLLKRTPSGHAPADERDHLAKPSYDLKALARQAGLLHALRTAVEADGGVVEQIDHEDANGQYELNFRHDEALRSCDRLLGFKLAAHHLAEAHGLVFSMMPKPFEHQPGSGMHFHVSLWAGPHGVFDAPPAADAAAPGDTRTCTPLSALGQHFVAGVLAHAPALTAIAAPTVNSYKRLAAGASASGTTWSPTVAAHGPNNRTALVRTLPGRFEWRLPDASANPYLAAAALVAAGLDGIDRALPLPAACTDDLYAAATDPAAFAARGFVPLPRTLAEACDALDADTRLVEALGAGIVALFVAAKRDEALAHARHVSAWEFERYATRF